MAPTFRLHLKFVSAIFAICFGFFLSCVESESTSDGCKCGKAKLPGYVLRVFGGRDLEEDEHPFLALLLKDSKYLCGGSIINSHFVLTAAHCIKKEGNPLENFYAVLGAHDRTQKYDDGDAQSRAVERIIMHPHYKSMEDVISLNDIALLKVKTIHFNARVQPICLPDIDLSRYRAAKIQGWDFRGNTGRIPREAIVGLVPKKECRMKHVQRFIGYPRDIHHMVLCTYEPASDACQGDSGGPLFLMNQKKVVYQIGIVSLGVCGNTKGRSSLHTRLSSYVDWIKHHIGTVCSPIA